MNGISLGLLWVALCLSGVSAYYSIVGLAAIFVASFWPVLLLATVLEVGKLVLVSWLYRNWRVTPWPIRTYLTGAVLVLMLITSLGIFGFLSKAHNQDQVITQQSELQITQLNTQLEIKQQQLTETRQVWEQINRSINIQLDANRAQQAMANRRVQQAERERLQTRMQELQAEIVALNQQRTQMQSTQTVQDSKLGAVRYVIQLFDPDADPQQAIKWIILVLVMVCDPLAVLMLMAANQSVKKPEEPNEPTAHMPTMLRWDPVQNKMLVQDAQGEWHEWCPVPAPSAHTETQIPDTVKLVEMSVTELLKQRPILEMGVRPFPEERAEHHATREHYVSQPQTPPVDVAQLQKLIETTLESWMNKTLTVTYTADSQDIDKIVEKVIQQTMHKQQDGEPDPVVPEPNPITPEVPPEVPPEPTPDVLDIAPQPESIQPEIPVVELTQVNAETAPTDRPVYNYFGEDRIRGGKKRIPIT